MHVSHICVLYLWRPEGRIGSSGTGVTGSYGLLCGSWVSNQDFLQEQVLSTAEPWLQPFVPPLFYLRFEFDHDPCLTSPRYFHVPSCSLHPASLENSGQAGALKRQHRRVCVCARVHVRVCEHLRGEFSWTLGICAGPGDLV
jgi:hypothetical protein